MSIIYKYLTGEILKYFGIVMLMVIGIYVAVDFFEKIDNFMEAGLSFSKAFSYFIFKVPLIIVQVMPVCILLAVIVVFGLMVKSNELIALKSSGVSIYYVLKPVLSIGILCTLLLFFISEVIVPITIGKANRIWIKEVKKRTLVTSKEKNIWIKGDRLITHIKYYNPSTHAIFGISLNYFDKNFRLIRRVDARKGLFKEGRWFLFELIEQNLNKENGKYNISFHEKRVEQLDLLPEDLKRVIKKSEEMSFKELFSYIKKVEKEGYDATIYRVDFYAKMAFPLVCTIMCIVGIAIGVRGKIKGALALGIACGIGMAFLYWIFYSFCLSLGYGEVLPPFVAAWAANLVFLCLAVFCLLNVE